MLHWFALAQAYPLGCAATWGAVMYLWEHQSSLLPESLVRSMNAIYRDGDDWKGWAGSAVPSPAFMATALLSLFLPAS